MEFLEYKKSEVEKLRKNQIICEYDLIEFQSFKLSESDLRKCEDSARKKGLELDHVKREYGKMMIRRGHGYMSYKHVPDCYVGKKQGDSVEWEIIGDIFRIKK